VIILVAIKQVPQLDNFMMDPATGTMIREGVESIVNPLDLFAVELGLRLREKHGGTLTAFTMGPPQAETALKEAIAMGCDAGVLITDRAFSGSDTLATSYTLSRAVKKMGHFDLILTGERATDGDTGQVGPCLAAWLGIPVATYVGSVESSSDSIIDVKRFVEEGSQLLRIGLPALLTVLKVAANPRLPTLRGKMNARQSTILTYGATDLDLDMANIGQRGSPTRVVRIFSPKVTRAGVTVKIEGETEAEDAVARLMDFLKERGLFGGRTE
jgi:electron transfer flavoprotein beta subunit